MSHHEAQNSLLNKNRIMKKITQFFIVKVTVRKNVNWNVHLTSTLIFFHETFNSHNIDGLKSSFAVLLNALLSSFSITSSHHKSFLNTTDQSILMFFVSLLLFVDIVASTFLDISFVLQHYHQNLLTFRDEGKCRVRLKSVVNCQNWTFVAIENISTFCAWKRDVKQSDNFSIIHFVNFATSISQAFEKGFTRLNIDATRF